MLNLRKLRQDFSSNILKEGKSLYEEEKVVAAKIIHLDGKTLRISGKVLGQFKNTYESELEIDRQECETIDSDCDCPYHCDCQHLAALLYYLEANIDKILVEYSEENAIGDSEEKESLDEGQEEILEAVKEAASKEELRKEEQYQRQLLQEYVAASKVLARSPFFLPEEEKVTDSADLAIIISLDNVRKNGVVEVQLALRLPSRSKPLHIPNIRQFLEAMRHEETITIGGKKYYFTLESFKDSHRPLMRLVLNHARFTDKSSSDKAQKVAFIESKIFGMLLAEAFDIAAEGLTRKKESELQEELPKLPCLFENGIETPLKLSLKQANFKVHLEFIQPPASKVLLNPKMLVDSNELTLEEVCVFECAVPGVLHNHIYYKFSNQITRKHLLHLRELRDVTIPEPLFGTFVENAMPELSRYSVVSDTEVVNRFVTLPYAHKMTGVCDLSFLNGELDASLSFVYDDYTIPAVSSKLAPEQILSFVKDEGVVARNLVEERKLIEELFRDFIFDQDQGVFIAKTEKKIIEFMTDIIPRFQDVVTFNCPQNLLDQFIYDETKFEITLSHLPRMDVYKIDLKVNGALKGVKMDRLWECILSKRAFIELESTRARKEGQNKLPKILVLDFEKIGSVVRLFDELGIEKLDNHSLERPIWSIANIEKAHFNGLPVKFTVTKRLQEIRMQMLGESQIEFSPVPKEIKADLRKYQEEGVHWLERLRMMFLNGILADDMGLGKTLQAIVTITQVKGKDQRQTLVVCPTSLLYNWKEEIIKFNPKLKSVVVDGTPNQRKKIIQQLKKYDIVITSYSLLQKDIDLYQKLHFTFTILDEAQHIKNRGTRNAKSVKLLSSEHKLILSGTPIENSLEELWSLFDFLMPGFLGSYDRFVEKYIRVTGDNHSENLRYLKKKVAPFILRRMKADVLHDLPPVSELVYHCQLSETQQELYKSYAESARNELVKLVERDGFDRVQIHVLATLTRLKQICCHPAIFAKESAETGDSAKYDMLLELLQTLIEGGHKTVIFSQYTKMLQIMRKDFESMGIKFVYLDGSSKNRLEIVKQFNEDPTISVFLVSLKAGGTGLNLVGADTVIHYDMWWNPAVENQATDRVYRIGQKQTVSVYKLVTLSTIEEKIVEMQARKQGLVKKVVSCDDEAISKLTWEDVLELLQT